MDFCDLLEKRMETELKKKKGTKPHRESDGGIKLKVERIYNFLL